MCACVGKHLGHTIEFHTNITDPRLWIAQEMVSNTVLMREDSVALAHRRLGNGLSGSMDSMPLSRDRLGLGTGVPPDAVPPAERESSGIRSAAPNSHQTSV